MLDKIFYEAGRAVGRIQGTIDAFRILYRVMKLAKNDIRIPTWLSRFDRLRLGTKISYAYAEFVERKNVDMMDPRMLNEWYVVWSDVPIINFLKEP